MGLTGGIGCGKSTVSALFFELNIPIIDADEIAHQLVKPGQPALTEISKLFGDQVLNSDGTLNRAMMRDLVFSDPMQKQRLESILHPLVYTVMQQKIDRLAAPYCIASIPLLFETQMAHFVDRILVIDCPVAMQIERVERRDGLDKARIQSIIESQVNREFRINHAHDVIDNSESGIDLAEDVKKLHTRYLSISASLVAN
ncbi:MAG: dephospho-CoA kinase [Methyloglobulus sp.]